MGLSQGSCSATGVIVAGGRSQRMGRNKLTLKIGGVAILDRVYNALASRCEEIVVIGAKEYAPTEARRLPVVRPDGGPLAAIEVGLLAARHRAVFVAAGDIPFLTSDFVEYLLGLLSKDISAVVPYFGGRPRPLCAVYSREVQPAVSAALDQGVRSRTQMLESLPRVRYVGEEELWRFGDLSLLFKSVNTPDDLAVARAAFREGAGYRGREAKSPPVPDSLVGELRALVRLYRGKSVFLEGDAPGGVEGAVVLGAQVLPGGRPSQTLKLRARHAAQLYAKGDIKLIIPTGGRGREHPPSEVEAMARMLRKAGVPEEVILIETEARDMRESARLVTTMAKEKGIRSLLVVTDPLQCVRAVGTFRAEGGLARASPVYRSPMWSMAKLRRKQFLREIGALLWDRIMRRVGSRFRP
jgi:molybdopterin-guanine dinucleotide biosynthesis protein A/uncharacterized SAM-binding protein YcdF (DUF218 family)